MNELERRRAEVLLDRENAKAIMLQHPDPTVCHRAEQIYSQRAIEAAQLFDEMEALQ